MNFSNKCAVLGQLWLFYREDAEKNEYWQQFFRINDIALPACYLIDSEYVTASENSDLSAYIDETWEMFCEFISIDADGEYEDIAAAFGASSNPPLDI